MNQLKPKIGRPPGVSYVRRLSENQSEAFRRSMNAALRDWGLLQSDLPLNRTECRICASAHAHEPKPNYGVTKAQDPELWAMLEEPVKPGEPHNPAWTTEWVRERFKTRKRPTGDLAEKDAQTLFWMLSQTPERRCKEGHPSRSFDALYKKWSLPDVDAVNPSAKSDVPGVLLPLHSVAPLALKITSSPAVVKLGLSDQRLVALRAAIVEFLMAEGPAMSERCTLELARGMIGKPMPAENARVLRKRVLSQWLPYLKEK